MNAKIEREKIINFKHESKMKDVGTFTKRLKIKRRSPRLDTAFVTTKAALTGGLAPLTRGEMLLIDAIATLNVYIEPVTDKGESLLDKGLEEGWVDDILDQEIIFAIHKEWIDYQNSFYPPEEVKPGGQDGEKTNPAAETPVQG